MLYTGRSRFALLIGGRARRLAIPCGIQTFTVVVHSLLLGVHEIRVILTVEEGGDYRYECRCRRDAYTKALLSSALYVMSIMLSCWIGSVISPVLREPMLELLPTIFAMSITGPALVPILHRVVSAITSELGGTIIGGVVFLWSTTWLRRGLFQQSPYFLERL